MDIFLKFTAMSNENFVDNVAKCINEIEELMFRGIPADNTNSEHWGCSAKLLLTKLCKELAKSLFERQSTLEDSESSNFSSFVLHAQENTFSECAEELRRMNDIVLFAGFSLYDVLQVRKHFKKMIYLAKNENFIAAFEVARKNQFFPHFGKDLDDSFREILRRRDSLITEERNMYLIFKDYLPDLVIRKIVCLKNEHLFFE